MLTEDQKFIIEELFENGAFKFGDFKLKGGSHSPIYIDLRIIVSFPKLLRKISEEIYRKINLEKIPADCVCGVPYAALPVATVLSVDNNVPMLILRKEVKNHGTGKRIEGRIVDHSSCLIIEDTVTTGSSIIETAHVLREHKLKISDVIVILDRGQGATDVIRKEGLTLHSLFSLPMIMQYLCESNKIAKNVCDDVIEFLQTHSIAKNGVTETHKKLSIDQRFGLLKHPKSKLLMEIMKEKQSNLCLSADLTDAQEILDLIPKIGSEICLLKLHADIIVNFSTHFVNELKKYAENLKFLILEDRKFGDIGNTVNLQISKGFAQISSWAHFVTVHSVAGAGTLAGLKEVCIENNIGCLIVAEMSSTDALCNNDTYKTKSYQIAKEYSEIVAGFICQKRLPENDDSFLYLTPGVNSTSSGDNKQQNWRSPESAIKEDGNDIVIIGRGIYQSTDPVSAARKYKTEAWDILTTCHD